MAQSSTEASVIKAYWQPGCTSCLRMKEFLTKHGVPFVSVNVLEDKDAFAELAMLGIRSVPIVRRGKEWAKLGALARQTRVVMIPWLNMDGVLRWPMIPVVLCLGPLSIGLAWLQARQR